MKTLKHTYKKFYLIIVSGLTVVMFPATALAAPFLPLNPASLATNAMPTVPNIILWGAIVVCAVICTLLGYSLIRLQYTPSDDQESTRKFRSNIILEAIWTIIPMLILAALLILTFQTIQNINPESEPVGVSAPSSK